MTSVVYLDVTLRAVDFLTEESDSVTNGQADTDKYNDHEEDQEQPLPPGQASAGLLGFFKLSLIIEIVTGHAVSLSEYI